jgi:hypothetical protein
MFPRPTALSEPQNWIREHFGVEEKKTFRSTGSDVRLSWVWIMAFPFEAPLSLCLLNKKTRPMPLTP